MEAGLADSWVHEVVEDGDEDDQCQGVQVVNKTLKKLAFAIVIEMCHQDQLTHWEHHRAAW